MNINAEKQIGLSLGAWKQEKKNKHNKTNKQNKNKGRLDKKKEHKG